MSDLLPERPSKCMRLTKWGYCRQETAAGEAECSYHARRLNRVDPYYEAKIVRNLLHPIDSYLTAPEINATIGGRKRNDGRRLDSFCSDQEQPGAGGLRRRW